MEEAPGARPSVHRRRPRISHEFVEEHRRGRYVDAVAELLHDFGRDGATVSDLVRTAGTARNTFYETFSGIEDCIAYGVSRAGGDVFAVLDRLDGEGEWPAEVGTAVAGFYAAVAAQPPRAELLLIHSSSCRQAEAREALPRGVERFADLLARGRPEAEARGRRPPPPLLDEYLAWVIATPAAGRVRSAAVAALPQESQAMTALVAGYYLGTDAVEEARPVAPSS
jgi:AcrR family transcriptional regulator